MIINQKDVWQRIANLSNAYGIAEIIESKSLINQVNIAQDDKISLVHEKILFATISQSPETLRPDMKLLSALGHFESQISKNKSPINENKKFLEQ